MLIQQASVEGLVYEEGPRRKKIKMMLILYITKHNTGKRSTRFGMETNMEECKG